MKVVTPTQITDALLVSSTVAEPSGSDPAAWVAATAYVVGNTVYRATTHRIYTRLVNGTTATAPESDPTNWSDTGPTNKWAMFDSAVNTATSGNAPLTVVMDPGQINSVALLEVVADTITVTVTDGPGGSTIYDATVSMDASYVIDWYGYFYEPFTQQTTLVLTDIPPYLAPRVTVTLNGTGTVSCGVLVVGNSNYIGGLQYGAKAGIRDYSTKTTDETTGVVTLVEGRYRKSLRGLLELAGGAVNSVHRLLSGLRATNAVWIGDDEALYEPLIVYGFCRYFELTVTYPGSSFYSIEIEGML